MNRAGVKIRYLFGSKVDKVLRDCPCQRPRLNLVVDLNIRHVAVERVQQAPLVLRRVRCAHEVVIELELKGELHLVELVGRLVSHYSLIFELMNPFSIKRIRLC